MNRPGDYQLWFRERSEREDVRRGEDIPEGP